MMGVLLGLWHSGVFFMRQFCMVRTCVVHDLVLKYYFVTVGMNVACSISQLIPLSSPT